MRLPGPRVILGTNLVLASGALAWVLWRAGGPALAVLGAAPSWSRLAAWGATVAVLVVVFALRWAMVLGGLGDAPGLGALTLDGLAGQSISLLVPSARLGGDPLRAYLLVQRGCAAAAAIASVAVDRVLDVGAGTAFAIGFAVLLLHHGLSAFTGTLTAVVLGAVALLAGVAVTVRRLRRRRGVVSGLVRSTGFDRLRAVERRLAAVDAAEACAGRLVDQPGRMAGAFVIGLAINALVLLEYHLLLSAFGLPANLVAVVGAIMASGAAHAMPVPAGVAVLEGSQMALFTALGYPPDVGLAVGLAVRVREIVWTVPGLLYLVGRGLGGFLVREATA